MKVLFFAFSVSLWTLSVAAQPATIGQPALGFVYDAQLNAIRAIRGIPGAAFLGEALPDAMALSSAAISPRHDLALTVAAEDRQLRLIRFGDNHSQSLPGALSSPVRVVFSP